MNESLPNDGKVDRLVGELLDSRETAALSAVDVTHLSLAERARAADLLLIDALLEQLQGRDALRNLERVDRVFAAIGPHAVDIPEDVDSLQPVSLPISKLPMSHERRSIVWWLPMALAASLLVAATAFVLQPSHSRAYAAVAKAYDALHDRTIREYEVTIEDSPRGGNLAATLWVSGGDRFALKHPAPLPGHFWIGSDGQQRWLVPVVGPVLTSDDAGQPRRWLMQQEAGLPFLQVSTMLGQLQTDYDLEMIDDERVHAHLRNAAFALPTDVDIWIDPSTGIVRKLELTWPGGSFKPMPRKVTLQLTSENAVGDEWFKHDSHHDSRRPVMRVGRAS